MSAASRVGAGVTPTAAIQHVLHGCDDTPGIVSVDADTAGHARVWQRDGRTTRLTEHAFPNWFLTTSLDLLAHLPARHVTAAMVRDAHGRIPLPHDLTVVTLDSPSCTGELDSYRYLVLTSRFDEVQTALIETANKREGEEANSLDDLRGLVLMFPPIEQFLMLTGRTYFKGLQYARLGRLQFDLETTGLNEERDRIFMISMHDDQGWEDCLDTAELSEAELIRRFVEIVQARDPDVLENHNIFAFDLTFLVRRAARLGVCLALGRDGSEPRLESDTFDSGERSEPFLRWRVSGREVVDTQHAVRRYGVGAPDLRRHGLKDAARYFGFAKEDREYVPGAEIWATYQTDPERVRRYAADDVDEVDGLSRRLLPAAFNLASLLPRAYERVAANAGPTAVWDPLLVRAYLHAGRAIPAPLPRFQRATHGSRAELLIKGVLGPAARASLRPLLPSVIATRAIHAVNDELAMLPTVVSALLQMPDEGARIAVEAAPDYLAGQGLFSDAQAANNAAERCRMYVDRLVDDLRAQDCRVIEVDSDQVTFGMTDAWTEVVEGTLMRNARSYLPDKVELTFAGPYRAIYVRAPRTAIVLGRDDSVTLEGSAFRPGRLERFGETFMHRAAPLALTGDVEGLRRVFLDTVHLLRTGQLPLEELCVQVTLHKSQQQYRRGGTHEEPYEVLLAAGVRSWRVGQRIRYFRARGGEPRLFQEGDGAASSADADAEYYVQRLSGLYAQQFAQAFLRHDFGRIFSIPAGLGPFEVDPAQLAGIQPVAADA